MPLTQYYHIATIFKGLSIYTMVSTNESKIDISNTDAIYQYFSTK